VKTPIQSQGLLTVGPPSRHRTTGDPRARALSCHDQRFRAEEVVCGDDRRAPDREQTGELALGREPRADGNLAARDRRPQLPGEISMSGA